MSAQFGLELTVTDQLEGTTIVRSFRKSTVRLGRNPLNDFHLAQNFVSQFHAVVDWVNGDVVLRDLGSTNGCIIGGRKLSGEATPLPAHNSTFDILTLSIKVRGVPLDSIPEPTSVRKPLNVTGLLQAPPADFFAALEHGAKKVEDPEEQRRIATLHKNYRQAWTALHDELRSASMKREPAERGAFVSKLSADLLGVSGEPDFHVLAADANAPSLTMRDTEREARIALEGLREIAQEFVADQPPPESPDDLVKFLTRLREVLELFFKSFLPLRDGQRQFRQELGIPAPHISSIASHVEFAKSTPELSSAVLDARQTSEALAHMESTFADLMIHQVAMLNGVMTGVKSLLAELSPDAIRTATEKLAGRGALSFGFGGAGPKQWWQVYEQRYGDLVEEEKQIFQLLFGKQFSAAYSQAASDSSEAKRSTLGFTPPPGRSPGER